MNFFVKKYDYEVEYDFDKEFWKDLVLPRDIEEAIEEDVRDCFDFFESTY